MVPPPPIPGEEVTDTKPPAQILPAAGVGVKVPGCGSAFMVQVTVLGVDCVQLLPVAVPVSLNGY